MGSYARFRLGQYEFGQIKNVVDDEVLAVFNDDMLMRDVRKARDYYDWWDTEHPVADDDAENDADVEVIRLTAPGPVIADRLEFLGITESEVCTLLRQEFESTAANSLDFGLQGNDYLSEVFRRTAEVAGELTIEGWLNSVRDLETAAQQLRPFEPGSPAWNLDLIDVWEWRHALRLLLLAFPEEEVELDLTDLFEGGWLDSEHDSYRPSVAMATLRHSLSTHAPIVVLTEGRTDAEFLRASLHLLYPHFDDLIRFLDYEVKPEGGAGAVLRTVKAFAAAGITNRVVAVLDNDAAARDALRSIDLSLLPNNIKVLHYPNLSLAASYPTLGPPSSGHPTGSIDNANVNGLAASIELYLGRDVLTDESHRLRPVQWRSFLTGVAAYHGEVTGKEEIHRKFREKVREAEDANLSNEDWEDVRSILRAIITSFQNAALPTANCEHTGRSEADLRLRRLRQ